MFIVYRITFDASGEYYIGKTTRKQWNKGYMGGGVRIRRLINKYGRDAFTREVIAETDNEPEAYAIEKQELGLRFGLDPLCVNLRSGGLGGQFGQKASAETRAKMSAAQKRIGNRPPPPAYGREVSAETRAKISASKKGKKPSPEVRALWSRQRRGRKLSPETIAKISKAQTGKKHTPEARAKISAANIGRKHTPETRAKMSMAKTGRSLSPEHCAKISAGQKRRREARAA